MRRFDYIYAALIGFAYVILIGFMTGMSMTWGDFISRDDFWGQSNVAAIAYMQIYHSIGVALAALPVGIVTACRYADRWFRPTLIGAIIGGSYMLLDQLRGVWILSQHGVDPEVRHIVSGVIDTIKTPLILLVITAGIFWALTAKHSVASD